MKQRKTKIKNPKTGEVVDAFIVNPKKMPDISVDIELEDDTILNFKVIISRVSRIHGQQDDDGNPFYVIHSANVLTVVDIHENEEKGKVNAK